MDEDVDKLAEEMAAEKHISDDDLSSIIASSLTTGLSFRELMLLRRLLA